MAWFSCMVGSGLEVFNQLRKIPRRCSVVGLSDEPVQHGIQIRLLLCADAITAHLPIFDVFQMQLLDELVHGQMIRQVALVPQDQQRYPVQRRFRKQIVQLLSRNGDCVSIDRVYYVSAAWPSSIRAFEATGLG